MSKTMLWLLSEQLSETGKLSLALIMYVVAGTLAVDTLEPYFDP